MIRVHAAPAKNPDWDMTPIFASLAGALGLPAPARIDYIAIDFSALFDHETNKIDDYTMRLYNLVRARNGKISLVSPAPEKEEAIFSSHPHSVRLKYIRLENADDLFLTTYEKSQIVGLVSRRNYLVPANIRRIDLRDPIAQKCLRDETYRNGACPFDYMARVRAQP